MCRECDDDFALKTVSSRRFNKTICLPCGRRLKMKNPARFLQQCVTGKFQSFLSTVKFWWSIINHWYSPMSPKGSSPRSNRRDGWRLSRTDTFHLSRVPRLEHSTCHFQRSTNCTPPSLMYQYTNVPVTGYLITTPQYPSQTNKTLRLSSSPLWSSIYPPLTVFNYVFRVSQKLYVLRRQREL